ncbi:hypothetical protein [Pimelobacter simplex]|uniref:hypothetical protein n=1 Tax=Nocardioides simplex TaxID=2045 RepID=UPI003AAAF601
MLELHEAHAAAAVLASPWLADHDRQIADAATQRPLRVVCELSDLLDQIAERIHETGRVGREDFLDIFAENDLADLLPDITQNWTEEARRG